MTKDEPKSQINALLNLKAKRGLRRASKLVHGSESKLTAFLNDLGAMLDTEMDAIEATGIPGEYEFVGGIRRVTQ